MSSITSSAKTKVANMRVHRELYCPSFIAGTDLVAGEPVIVTADMTVSRATTTTTSTNQKPIIGLAFSTVSAGEKVAVHSFLSAIVEGVAIGSTQAVGAVLELGNGLNVDGKVQFQTVSSPEKYGVAICLKGTATAQGAITVGYFLTPVTGVGTL